VNGYTLIVAVSCCCSRWLWDDTINSVYEWQLTKSGITTATKCYFYFSFLGVFKVPIVKDLPEFPKYGMQYGIWGHFASTYVR